MTEASITDTITPASQEKLKQTIAAIERLEEDKAGISADIAAKYAEAKAFGFDVGILREIIKRRKKDRQEIEEKEMLLDTYLAALDG